MSDKGLLTMDLVCPEGHVAGQLIRNIEHQANEIQVPSPSRERSSSSASATSIDGSGPPRSPAARARAQGG